MLRGPKIIADNLEERAMRLLAIGAALVVHMLLHAPIMNETYHWEDLTPLVVVYDIFSLIVFPALWWWERGNVRLPLFMKWFLYYLFIEGLIFAALLSMSIWLRDAGWIFEFFGFVSYALGCMGRELLIFPRACEFF